MSINKLNITEIETAPLLLELNPEEIADILLGTVWSGLPNLPTDYGKDTVL